MIVNRDCLPKTAKNGFFINTSIGKRYGSRPIAVAPIRETAKTWYCCEVTRKCVNEHLEGDYLCITDEPGSEFCKDWQGEAYVYRVPKKDYPKTDSYRIDMYR